MYHITFPFHWSKQVLESLLICPSFCGKVFNNKLNVTIENEMDGYMRFPQRGPGSCRQLVQTCQPVWLPTILPNVTSHAECRILHQCIECLWRFLGKTHTKNCDPERLSHLTKVTQLIDKTRTPPELFLDENKNFEHAKENVVVKHYIPKASGFWKGSRFLV